MADGSRDTQRGFGFPAPQTSALRPGEIVVDLFAGGGGASEALKQALGVDPALAYNHDADAIGMHAANHPLTDHHREDIWHADPVRDVGGRDVGWFHASPDCTHFSQAKGGQPRSKATRSLSWVVLKWAGSLAKAGHAPRIISLENVTQILSWGPLIAKRDKATGRVIKLDGTIAAAGERVSVWDQSLVPDKRRAGRTWSHFVAALRRLGYAVEWRALTASDFGAGTSRKRLFLLARRDGEAIQWPEPTHGPGRAHPFVTAADCIDFSDRGTSIFDRPRPLADATMRRIARGVMRHVLQSADPFIVPATHQGSDRVNDVREPMRTITAANRGELMLVTPQLAPFVTEHANSSAGRTWSADEPLRTQCAGVKGGHFAAVTAALVKFRGESSGSPMDAPVPTITSGAGAKRPAGAAHALGVMTAFLEQANGGFYAGTGRDARQPMSTITATGSQQQLVTTDLAELSPEAEAGALRVAAFLINYYGNGTALDLTDPLPTVTTRDRMALVTVTIQGTPYVIVDIALRMLRPPELYRAQGFPFFQTRAKIKLWRDPTTCAEAVQERRSARANAHPAATPSEQSSRLEPSNPVALHALIDFVRSDLVLRSPGRSSSGANTAGEIASFPLPTKIAAFAPQFVRPNTIPGPAPAPGRVGAQLLANSSTHQGRGDKCVSASGGATTQLAAAVKGGMRVEVEGSRFITSPAGPSSPTSASILKTLSSYVVDVIDSCIRAGTLTGSSFDVELTAESGYIIQRTADGRPLTISAQVRMVGNSVSPPPLLALAHANLDHAVEPARMAA